MFLPVQHAFSALTYHRCYKKQENLELKLKEKEGVNPKRKGVKRKGVSPIY